MSFGTRRGDEEVADTLGQPRFAVAYAMDPVSTKTSQTHELAEFLDESRLAEIMTLLCQVSLGGRTLDPASKDFRLRSQRLRSLKVFRVPDVVLTLSVTLPGLERPVTVKIGEGADKDAFLDQSTPGKPVLFHDFQGADWFDNHVKRRLG